MTEQGTTARRPIHVLLAVDDSDTSLRAARGAHGLFGDDAKYFIVNVGTEQLPTWRVDPMTWGVPYPLALGHLEAQGTPFQAHHSFESEVPSAVDRAEQEARSVSTAASLPTDTVAVGATGDAVDRIRQVADDESIDVIVVGGGSASWWRHLFDPSVSKAVVRDAERPVLVVP